jgi:hypothetical protein
VPLNAVFNLFLTADFPNDGRQQIVIASQTRLNGCVISYAVCDNLAFLNWHLSVTYTSNYDNGTGPSLAGSFVQSWSSSAGDILPSATAPSISISATARRRHSSDLLI